MIVTRTITLTTRGNADTINITPDVEKMLAESGVKNGAVTAFITHTTCGITIIEDEPGLISDFKSMWHRLIPRDIPYEHPDNGYAHVRASLLGQSLVVPITNGKLTLGVWQQIILIDFDNRPREREAVLQFAGE